MFLSSSRTSAQDDNTEEDRRPRGGDRQGSQKAAKREPLRAGIAASYAAAFTAAAAPATTDAEKERETLLLLAEHAPFKTKAITLF